MDKPLRKRWFLCPAKLSPSTTIPLVPFTTRILIFWEAFVWQPRLLALNTLTPHMRPSARLTPQVGPSTPLTLARWTTRHNAKTPLAGSTIFQLASTVRRVVGLLPILPGSPQPAQKTLNRKIAMLTFGTIPLPALIRTECPTLTTFQILTPSVTRASWTHCFAAAVVAGSLAAAVAAEHPNQGRSLGRCFRQASSVTNLPRRRAKRLSPTNSRRCKETNAITKVAL